MFRNGKNKSVQLDELSNNELENKGPAGSDEPAFLKLCVAEKEPFEANGAYNDVKTLVSFTASR